MIFLFKGCAMELTVKDKDFLTQLRVLLDSKGLSIELKNDGLKRLVLRPNYGEKIESAFGLSRQGVRWRFQRLFNEIYVQAYCTIFWVESYFGTELRQMALEIAKEQVALRKEARKRGHFDEYGRIPTAQKYLFLPYTLTKDLPS